MANGDEQLESLYDAVLQSGISVVKSPYTEIFERHFDSSATLHDKHDAYERLLRRGGVESESPTAIAVPHLPTATDRTGEGRQSPDRAIPKTGGAAQRPTSHVQGELFAPTPVVAMQPWVTAAQLPLSQELRDRRRRLQADVANSRLGRREAKVAYILHHFPETRDSDTALCIRYWKQFQGAVLAAQSPFDLEVLYSLDRIETLGRMRRVLQNKLLLYRGTWRGRAARDAFQAELHRYLAERKLAPPEIRFYFDETGNEGASKRFRGIGGICALNWRQFEIFHSALVEWRQAQASPNTIRFADLDQNSQSLAIALLHQLQERRSGLLFVGHAIESRGSTHQDLVALCIQLVIDTLRRADELGCLEGPHTIRVIKEAEEGFDKLYLAKLSYELEQSVAIEFPERLVTLPVEAHAKGRDVMLECADLIAGGMQRRALFAGTNPKDRLAEAIMNVAGFEDKDDPGAVFNYFPPGRIAPNATKPK